MARWLHGGHPDSDLLALEAEAEGAGTALACVYSSSAELDAALIAARRAAGVYGPKRQRRLLMASAVALTATLAVILLLARLIG
jgi:hypothetical protein